MNALSTAATAAREWVVARPVWLAFLLLVLGSLLAAYALTVFGFALVRRATAHTRTDFDDVVATELRVPLTLTVGAAGFYLAGRWLALAPGEGTALRAGAATVVLLGWAWGVTRVGDRLIERVGPESELGGVAPIFENVLNIVVVAVTTVLVLSLWRIDVTPLLASAGIVGIAVGFAARDTIANFFGSIALYVDDTYAVGDYVELDSGETGTVVDISVRSTRLVTRDDVVITVPNSVLNSARIVNQSAPGRRTRVTVPVGVAYGSDIEAVEAVLIDVAAEAPLVLDSPSPRARFRRFGDSALEYELLCWVPTPLRAAKATHQLNRGIYTSFRAAGIDIPFPRRDVRVVSETEPAPSPDSAVQSDTVES